jgi:hypothetical protein
MPTLDLGDFSKIGVLPPVGHYRLQVTKNPKHEPNKKKDGHSFVLKNIIIDSPDEAFENFPVTAWASTKVAARWKLKEILEAITQEPWDDENVQLELDDDDVLIDPALEDRTFIALIEHSDDGKNANIKTFFPDDGSVEIGLIAEDED